ncbi:DUF6223 family protein, partial [Streptomyces hydrogenans]
MSLMPVRRHLATGATALLAAVALAVVAAGSAAASAPAGPVAASVTTFGPGRIGSSAGALLGLLGLVAAWRALTRPTGRLGTTTGPRGALLALSAGAAAVVLG